MTDASKTLWKPGEIELRMRSFPQCPNYNSQFSGRSLSRLAGMTHGERLRRRTESRHTGMVRFWCARPMIAASRLWPAMTRTPSSSLATMVSGLQPSR